MLIYRGFLYANAIAGTNAFIFSINATSSLANRGCYSRLIENRLPKPAKRPKIAGLVRLIIGVGQALSPDCCKAKGMTVTKRGCRPVSLQKHRRQSLQATSKSLERFHPATITCRLG
jgi:hypothetical protein